MAALTGLLGEYGSDDESAATDNAAAGPHCQLRHHKIFACNLQRFWSVTLTLLIVSSVAASADDMDTVEAGEASSRPASAMHTGVEDTPEVPDDQPTIEADIQGSPQQSSQFQLPPDIAEPPDRLCSAAVQVVVCLCKRS